MGKKVFAILVLVLAGAAPSPASQHHKLTPADKAKRQALLANPSNLQILPGVGAGQILLGEGQDQVLDYIGQPDYSWDQNFQGHRSTTWNYYDLNLQIVFDDNTAAPYVYSVSLVAWQKGNHTLGEIYWDKNVETPQVNWATLDGIGLGTTSFDLIRKHPDPSLNNTLIIQYSGDGMSYVTSVDHRITTITVLRRGTL